MNKFTIKFGFASILACALFISSCSKESNNALVPEGTTVRLNIGQAYAKNSPAKTASVGRTYASATQTVEIPFDNQYTLVASLTAEEATAPSLKASSRAATVSAGNETQALKQGTVYYVAIFDAVGDYKETKTFTQGNSAQDFAIETGKYTFVIYASGSNKTLPSIAAGTKLSAVNFEGLTADQDFMLDQVPFEVKDGQNILNADLEHLFTQVTLKFDASAIGAVSSIAGATIEPSNAAVDVNLTSSALTFKGAVNPVAFKLKNTTGTVINSDSTFITTAATTNGIVWLKGLSIGGSVAKDINKGGWNLKPGVKYVLEFKLKKPTEVNIGGEVWALDNLVYDPSTNVYSFGKGDYWFPGRLLPKKIDSENSNPSANGVNGGNGDPCALVAPANKWRLPNESEVQLLWDRTNPKNGGKGADNPNVTDPWYPARYVDYFNATPTTDLGMFFGVKTDRPVVFPVSGREKYLFFPYRGYYPNDNLGAVIGKEGAYLVSATTGGYKTLHLTGAAGDDGTGIGWRAATNMEAVQIRCVQK